MRGGQKRLTSRAGDGQLRGRGAEELLGNAGAQGRNRLVQNWLLSLLKFCKSLIIKVPAEGVESTLLGLSGSKWCRPTQEIEKIGR
jgi:hypothetical protein